MKKLLHKVFALVAIISFSTHIEAATNAWNLNGEGTAENPYLIESAADMMQIADNISVSNTGKGEFFLMTTDIDFGGSATSPVQLPSIGKAAIANITTIAYGFDGTFDGNGHKISGIYHTNNSNDANGKFNALFASIGTDGVVKNIIFTKDNTITSYNYTAAIASVSKGTIDNCENNADITTASTFAAGICAQIAMGTGTITNCTNTGDIKAQTYACGIVAGAQSGAAVPEYKNLIENCANYGTISSTNATTAGCAGIAGSYSGAIKNCQNHGLIDCNGKQYTGGILATGSYAISIENCTNDAEVRCGKNSGGVIGYLMKANDADVLIANCINNGNINASSNADNVGGILGNHAHTAASTITLEGCENYGVISGGNDAQKGNLRGNATVVLDGWTIGEELALLALDPEKKYSPTGVSTVKANRHNTNNTTYNLAGMKVNASYKGIVIINGKKLVR